MKLPILGWMIDERFLTHRLRSTSIGGLAGVLLAGLLFLLHVFRDDRIEWELFAIVATAAVVKVAAVMWYRLKD